MEGFLKSKSTKGAKSNSVHIPYWRPCVPNVFRTPACNSPACSGYSSMSFNRGSKLYFIQKFGNIHRSYRNLVKCAKLIVLIGISIVFLFVFDLYVRIGEKNRNLN